SSAGQSIPSSEGRWTSSKGATSDPGADRRRVTVVPPARVEGRAARTIGALRTGSRSWHQEPEKSYKGLKVLRRPYLSAADQIRRASVRHLERSPATFCEGGCAVMERWIAATDRGPASSTTRRAVPGIFTISLDFELFWGVHDKRSLKGYGRNILGARDA